MQFICLFELGRAFFEGKKIIPLEPAQLKRKAIESALEVHAPVGSIKIGIVLSTKFA